MNQTEDDNTCDPSWLLLALATAVVVAAVVLCEHFGAIDHLRDVVASWRVCNDSGTYCSM